MDGQEKEGRNRWRGKRGVGAGGIGGGMRRRVKCRNRIKRRGRRRSYSRWWCLHPWDHSSSLANVCDYSYSAFIGFSWRDSATKPPLLTWEWRNPLWFFLGLIQKSLTKPDFSHRTKGSACAASSGTSSRGRVFVADTQLSHASIKFSFSQNPLHSWWEYAMRPCLLIGGRSPGYLMAFWCSKKCTQQIPTFIPSSTETPSISIVCDLWTFVFFSSETAFWLRGVFMQQHLIKLFSQYHILRLYGLWSSVECRYKRSSCMWIHIAVTFKVHEILI